VVREHGARDGFGGRRMFKPEHGRGVIPYFGAIAVIHEQCAQRSIAITVGDRVRNRFKTRPVEVDGFQHVVRMMSFYILHDGFCVTMARLILSGYALAADWFGQTHRLHCNCNPGQRQCHVTTILETCRNSVG